MKELFTELLDRVLRFDGVSLLHPNQVQEFLLRGIHPKKIRVTELTEDIKKFNEHVVLEEQLSDELLEPISFNMSWNIPVSYLELDVKQYILNVFEMKLPALAYSDEQVEKAINRLDQELVEFEKRGLFNILKTIIYILDKFEESNQVYGVGRGSSCASFVLFLLGLHVVDPVKFDVPLEEFMHD